MPYQETDPWTRIERNTVADHKYGRALLVLNRHVDGQEYTGIVFESEPCLVVLPITPEGKVVMVAQYRHGAECVTLELPGGGINDGQTPEEAALHELLTETGYVADPEKLQCTGTIIENAAQFEFSRANGVHVFTAQVSSIPEHEPQADEKGSIPDAVHAFSTEELVSVIEDKGLLINDSTFARLEAVSGLVVASYVIEQLSHTVPIEKQLTFVEFS